MPKRSQTAERLIIISILYIAIAAISLYWIDTAGHRHNIYRRSDHTEEFTHSMAVRGSHSYTVTVSLRDIGWGIARVEGTVRLYLDSELVETLTLSDVDESSIPDARDSASCWLYPETDGELRIELSVDSGNSWTISVYEDLPQSLDFWRLAFTYLEGGSILLMTGVSIWYLHYNLQDSDRTRPRNEQSEDDELERELGA